MSSSDAKKDSKRPESDSQEIAHDDQSGESVEGDQPKTASVGGDLTDGVEQESHSVDASSQEGVMKESHPIEGLPQDPQVSLGPVEKIDGGLAGNPPKSSDDWARLIVSEVNQATSLAEFRSNLERVMNKFREENTEVALKQSIEVLHQENTRLALENEVLKQINSKEALEINQLGKEKTDLLEKLAFYTMQSRLNASDPDDLTTQEVEILKEKARQCEEMLAYMEAQKSQLEMRVQQMKHGSDTHNKGTETSGGEDSEKQDQDQTTDKD